MQVAIDDYLRHHEVLGLAETTLKHYRKRLLVFWVFVAARGVKRLQAVTLAHVNAYHDDMIDRGLAVSTRSAYMITIQSFLHWSYRQGKLLTDIARRIELPQLERKLPPTPLTMREINDLIHGMPFGTETQRRNRAMVEVLYACGLRRFELVGLNVGDVDFVEETLFVRGKGGKERLLPIHETACRTVARYLETRPRIKAANSDAGRASPPLFVTTGPKPRRISIEVVQELFQRLNRQIPKHLHPHLLRHTFAVHLLQHGADLVHVQALLGHESADTTSKYLGLVKGELKLAYDRGVQAFLAM